MRTAEYASEQPASIDADFISVLRDIDDPEIGVNIVDLGLVYRAKWTTEGISVLMTMTTPSCPMTSMLADEVRSVLRRQFPDAVAVTVEVCHDPLWTPDRITDAGRRQLGWTTKTDGRTHGLLSWSAALVRNRMRH